jgi:hypothetical protein
LAGRQVGIELAVDAAQDPPGDPVPLGDGADAGLSQPDHAELGGHEEAVERDQGEGEDEIGEVFHAVRRRGTLGADGGVAAAGHDTGEGRPHRWGWLWLADPAPSRACYAAAGGPVGALQDVPQHTGGPYPDRGRLPGWSPTETSARPSWPGRVTLIAVLFNLVRKLHADAGNRRRVIPSHRSRPWPPPLADRTT